MAPTKRENYRIHILKTKAPTEFNVEGGYRALILHSYCTTISVPGFGQLVSELLSVHLDYFYIYFI